MSWRLLTMDSFGHKMIISSQPVPLMGTGVLYPRVRDFFFIYYFFLIFFLNLFIFYNFYSFFVNFVYFFANILIFIGDFILKGKNLTREDTKLPFPLKELVVTK